MRSGRPNGLVRRLGWVGLLATAFSGCTRSELSPYATSGCPLPPGTRGYPVSAHSVDGTMPAAFLSEVARGIGIWLPPSHTRRSGQSPIPPDLVRRLVLLRRGLPLDRSGWTPTAGDTAQIALIYRRGTLEPVVRPALSRGRGFERQALVAVRRALAERAKRQQLPTNDTLPVPAPLPEGEDSAVVLLAFGREPRPGDGVVRFAIEEHSPAKIRLLLPEYPFWAQQLRAEGDVVVAFLLLPDSEADVSSIRVLSANRSDFADAAVAAVRAARFSPGMVDCRPVPTLLLLPIRFRMRPDSSGPS